MLPKTALVWWNLRIQICEYNVFIACPSALRVLTGASLAETNNLMAASSPMKLGACCVLAVVFWKLFPGLQCFPYAITVHPPSGGGSDLFDITASWLRLTDMVTTLSMDAL